MESITPVDACDFVVFGGTGDLAVRKLLPALYLRDRDGQLPDGDPHRRRSPAPGSTTPATATRSAASCRASCAPPSSTTPTVERFARPAAPREPGHRRRPSWHQLLDLLKDGARAEDDRSGSSTSPSRPALFGPVSQRLAEHGLVTDARSRLVLEKPIGHDLASAREVNDAVGAVFEEQQIFRIDHYLGKESVQNLLVTRFANTFLEPLWNANCIDHVQITASESLGVGSRGGYYDGSGALRDMVQNHLLQLLCLVAMEPPTYVDRETVRDEKLKVLQALRPLAGARRGPRRRRRAVRRRPRRRASPRRRTATTRSGPTRPPRPSWRSGPRCRTGAGPACRSTCAPASGWTGACSEIVDPVQGRRRTRCSRGSEGANEPNRLVIQLQPDEGMRLHMTAKEPGPGGIRLRPVSLDLSYAADLPAPLARRLRAAADGRRARQPDPVHAPRRGRGRVGLGRADPRALGPSPSTPAAPYPAGTQRSQRRDHAPRARRPRPGTRAARAPAHDPDPHPPRRRGGHGPHRRAQPAPSARPTSQRTRRGRRQRGPARGRLACANLAHGFAASGAPATRPRCAARSKPNVAIVSAYNDMLSAHQPFETFPAQLKKAVHALRRHRPVRRRRARDVRRHHPGPRRHAAVAVQPRRDRDVDRDRALPRHVRRAR